MMVLKVGDIIPHFTVKDSFGNVFDSTTIVGKKPVIFYFYPKDNSLGCTAQACGFRDQYQDFTDLGAEVIGISSDSVTSHEKFAHRYKLPFLLLSDSNKKLQKLFGVKTNLFGLLPGRVTYVVDSNGIIQLIFDSVLPFDHITKSLAATKKIITNNRSD